LLRQLRCSASIQTELIERISEIAAARGETRLQILREPAIDTILEDSQLNHREKTQTLRDLLTRWRFPRLHAREERFKKDLSALGLPKEVRLLPPHSFEGDVFRLQIDFSSRDELSSRIETARGVALDPRLETLLHPNRPEQA
jgi:ParB family chromosome partitioning protein